VVIDTSVFVSALLVDENASREVVRRSLRGDDHPLMGAALYLEYEAVLNRTRLFRGSPLAVDEREVVLEAFLAACEWTRIFFRWRPNLRDESDNHLIELAVAGGANALVTRNLRDFHRTELRFPELHILKPESFVQECESWEL